MRSCFPPTRADCAAVGASGKCALRIRWNHHGMALAQVERPGRETAGGAIRRGLEEMFG